MVPYYRNAGTYEEYLQQKGFTNSIKDSININTFASVASAKALERTMNKGFSGIMEGQIGIMQGQKGIMIGQQMTIAAVEENTEYVKMLGNLVAYGFDRVNNNLEGIKNEISEFRSDFNWAMGKLIQKSEAQELLLKDIKEALKIPDSQKQKAHHIELGLKFMQKDLIEDAYSEFRNAYELDKKDPFLLSNIGKIKLFQLDFLDIENSVKFFSDAGKYYLAIVEDDKKAAENYFFAGIAEYILENYDKALEYTEKSLKIDPKLNEAKYNKAKFLCASGKGAESIDLIKELVNSDKIYAIKLLLDGDFKEIENEILNIIDEVKDKALNQINDSYNQIFKTLEKKRFFKLNLEPIFELLENLNELKDIDNSISYFDIFDIRLALISAINVIEQPTDEIKKDDIDEDIDDGYKYDCDFQTVITDTKTGLMWQANLYEGIGDENPKTVVKDYCKKSAAGFTDWRLPMLSELKELMNIENIEYGKNCFHYLGSIGFFENSSPYDEFLAVGDFDKKYYGIDKHGCDSEDFDHGRYLHILPVRDTVKSKMIKAEEAETKAKAEEAKAKAKAEEAAKVQEPAIIKSTENKTHINKKSKKKIIIIGLLFLTIIAIAVFLILKPSANEREISANERLNANNNLLKGASSGSIEQVRNALQSGADVNTSNNMGRNALILASYSGHAEIIKLLIQERANVNVADNNGVTALIVASHKGRAETVRLLIKAGADVNAKTNIGVNALMSSAMQGHTEIAKLLVEAGADVNAKSRGGLTALICAASERHSEIVRILKQAGARE